MPRLKRVDVSTPGITRRRRGRGFQYLDESGRTIRNEEVIERINALAIPPAWEDVWICTFTFGHIQATGSDAAGRKQYRYHDHWRERRDREKFDSMIDFARSLPRLRQTADRDLARGDLSRERVLGGATRLLDRGFFRIGSEGYAVDNETYGLATIRKDHVTVKPDAVVFDYDAKGSQRRVQQLADPELLDLLGTLRRRRSGGPELLAYKEGRHWRDVRSQDINDYVKEAADGDFSAKDFRTWNATVLAAIGLAVSGEMAGASKTARQRAARRAVDEVARYLGNTPAVCRASYIDPRVFGRFDGGLTIGGVLPDLAADGDDWSSVQRSVEEGVLDLIAGNEGSEAVERVA
ncbi:MAG: DNA topoisomerase IB [Thermoleophilaceae bacterium]|nr:DNA topoisomerase IB [Thermoleophilaceae bacterium]